MNIFKKTVALALAISIVSPLGVLSYARTISADFEEGAAVSTPAESSSLSDEHPAEVSDQDSEVPSDVVEVPNTDQETDTENIPAPVIVVDGNTSDAPEKGKVLGETDVNTRGGGSSSEQGLAPNDFCQVVTTIVSDGKTAIKSNDQDPDSDGYAVAVSPLASYWDAEIDGATWIWPTATLDHPEEDQDVWFMRTIDVPGVVKSAILDVAVDNFYSVHVDQDNNGDAESDVTYLIETYDPSLMLSGDGHNHPDNFTTTTQEQYDITGYIHSGENLLDINVLNIGDSQNPQKNFAGLLYKLTVVSTVDGPCQQEPTRGEVTVYKMLDGERPTGSEYKFPMLEEWMNSGQQKGPSQADYTLDSKHENPEEDYTHVSPNISFPGFYTTYEVTSDVDSDSRVHPTNDECTPLHCPADLNNDGMIDQGDLDIVTDNWSGTTTPECGPLGGIGIPGLCNRMKNNIAKAIALGAPATPVEGDVNGDGVVDINDLTEVILHWGPCNTFQLQGYTTGDTFEEANNPKNISTEAPVFDPLNGDKIVLVWNNTCRPTEIPRCEAGQELLSNGGFENPEVTNAAGWDIFDSGLAGLGWLVDWATPEKGQPDVAKLELHRGVAGWTHAEGNQHAELDSDWGGPSDPQTGEPASVKIYQDVPTIVGQTYKLSLAFSPRPATDATENQLEVKQNDTVLDTLSEDGSALSDTNWSNHEYNFVASTTVTRIALTDVGVSNSVGTFVDNVSLMCDPEDNDGGDNGGDDECNVNEDCGTGGDNSDNSDNSDNGGGGGSSGHNHSASSSNGGVGGGDGEVLGAETGLPGLPSTGTGAAQQAMSFVYTLSTAIAVLSLALGVRKLVKVK